MKLTIFTPVYNRADMISDLYESLERQTNKDFVWLVVDDGSTDNLKQVINRLSEKATFDIEYTYQKNSGKHGAHNTGVKLCTTELFFCVDSDDCLTDNAVERICAVHEKYAQENVLGYYFRKKDTQGNVSGGEFTLKSEKVGLREIYFKYGFVGELAIVLKTDLIKPYSFPVYDNERFVSEKVFYNQITALAPMVYTDETIYLYEYQPTGYTMNSESLLCKNPAGTAMGYLSDAIYGTNCVARAKAYSTFAAMKKVFAIPDEYYSFKKPPLSVRILARMLRVHYISLLRGLNEKYNKGGKA